MENIYKKLDHDMIVEIHDVVEAMGGALTKIDMSTKTLNIEIDPDVEEDAYRAVEHIIVKYSIKKKTILRERPFYRAEIIKKDLDE